MNSTKGMKTNIFFLVAIVLFSISSSQIFAQTAKSKRRNGHKASILRKQVNNTLSAQDKAAQNELQELEKDSKFRSPVRYVVVYKEINEDTNNRMIDVLIAEQQYNQKNLKAVFDLIKKRFPSPDYLSINVHTSLATIETPEEREKQGDGCNAAWDLDKQKARGKRFEPSYFRSKTSPII